MWLYLLPIKTGTSGTYNRGRDEWFRDNHILQDMNLITRTVEFDNKSSADPGSRKEHQEMLEMHLGNQGVLAGGMLAPDRHRLNLHVICELLLMFVL